ncbi:MULTISPECIES: catalase family peroxidase [unclassified Rhizobium]|uniref:catalase family peroxidase n=1 Tax=unclassified Rhizobium TaxID=2613769 RepID=UPI0016226E89|nr:MULTISPECIES: catalase family peroxidase [unclassified Rhizobium]MBB3543049.1 catalase [Rhizobium sp. BK399]MCS3742266.1 catalase [Rhizobium sp. BK661]
MSKITNVIPIIKYFLATAAVCATAMASPSSATDQKETPQDLVNALHGTFGAHHQRAVHTKGVMVVGSFTPDNEARALTTASLFTGGTRPVIARFSLFAGVPDIPDTANGAAPTGLAIKIAAKDGTEFDFATDQHNGFVVATSDEFANFLRLVAASGPGVAHPTPLETFLQEHPVSKHFVETLTSPASYATATFFGINSFKFTNAGGNSVFVRYRFVPKAGEHYLTPAELKAMKPNYLQDDIVARIAKKAVRFDWYAQIAEAGDRIEDPSIAWPESRKLVKLGSFTFDRLPEDKAIVDKQTLFLPGSSHPGIDPADPMLTFRNHTYPISFGERQ